MFDYSRIAAALRRKNGEPVDFVFAELVEIAKGSCASSREASAADQASLSELEAVAFDDAPKPDFATKSDPSDHPQSLVGHRLPASVDVEPIVYTPPQHSTSSTNSTSSTLLTNATSSHPVSSTTATPSNGSAEGAARPKAAQVERSETSTTDPKAIRLQTIRERVASNKGRGRHKPRHNAVRCLSESYTRDERRQRTALHISLYPAYAFSLLLSHEQAAYLSNLKDRDPARAFSQSFYRKCRKVLGRTLWLTFQFESSEEGTMHLHGAIIPEDVHEPTLRLILKQAAGVIHGPAAAFQLEWKPLRDRHWYTYCVKAAAQSAEAFGTDKLYHASEGLKREAMAHNDKQRRLERAYPHPALSRRAKSN
ncbi:hypothetical protein [Rhizobium halophilum]|uniref:hypothetical protein n=1 Tax=Rhizobium halophilum TaxID=2846852 RepID=UPI001EFCBC73|nr:hypothetical protein [Rhizobium halophilum]MCF6370970.1 hypothetical protein [Rhizobium halophilum]